MKIVWGRSIGYNIDHWLNYYKRDGIWYMRILDRHGMAGEKIEHRGSWWLKMEYSIITNGVDCHPWSEYFAILPRKTITGERIFWQKAYKRRVWKVWGAHFHMEPITQYGTVFDILND